MVIILFRMAEFPGTLSGTVPSASAVLLVARCCMPIVCVRCLTFSATPGWNAEAYNVGLSLVMLSCCGGSLILFSCQTIILLSVPMSTMWQHSVKLPDPLCE